MDVVVGPQQRRVQAHGGRPVRVGPHGGGEVQLALAVEKPHEVDGVAQQAVHLQRQHGPVVELGDEEVVHAAGLRQHGGWSARSSGGPARRWRGWRRRRRPGRRAPGSRPTSWPRRRRCTWRGRGAGGWGGSSATRRRPAGWRCGAARRWAGRRWSCRGRRTARSCGPRTSPPAVRVVRVSEGGREWERERERRRERGHAEVDVQLVAVAPERLHLASERWEWVSKWMRAWERDRGGGGRPEGREGGREREEEERGHAGVDVQFVVVAPERLHLASEWWEWVSEGGSEREGGREREGRGREAGKEGGRERE